MIGPDVRRRHRGPRGSGDGAGVDTAESLPPGQGWWRLLPAGGAGPGPETGRCPQSGGDIPGLTQLERPGLSPRGRHE